MKKIQILIVVVFLLTDLYSQNDCYAIWKKELGCISLNGHKKYNYFVLIRETDTIQLINYLDSRIIKNFLKKYKNQYAFCVNNMSEFNINDAKKVRKKLLSYKIYSGEIEMATW
jgi:hypothetical protein